jgi:integrase
MPDRLWPGGFIRTDSKGRDVYVIQRMIRGTRYKVSTRCHALRPAMKQLEAFEANPEGYKPQGEGGPRGLEMTPELVREFLKYSREVDKNSPEWVADQNRYLSWWGSVLSGRDLRSMSLEMDLLPALEGMPARRQRVETIKRLYSWLRTDRVGLRVKPAEDPTFGALHVPQARPEQWKRIKAPPYEHVMKVQERLSGHWRAAFIVLAGTGWHFREAQRFARAGEVERHPVNGNPVLYCPQRKSGEPMRTEVSDAVAAAAKELRKHGALDKYCFILELRRASAEAKVPALKPGSIRHGVATWAQNNGATLAQIAAFLGHKSPRTTKRLYATHGVAEKVPTFL